MVDACNRLADPCPSQNVHVRVRIQDVAATKYRVYHLAAAMVNTTYWTIIIV